MIDYMIDHNLQDENILLSLKRISVFLGKTEQFDENDEKEFSFSSLEDLNDLTKGKKITYNSSISNFLQYGTAISSKLSEPPSPSPKTEYSAIDSLAHVIWFNLDIESDWTWNKLADKI